MKKYYLLTLIAIALAAASCSNHDIGENNGVHYFDLGIIESAGDGNGYYFRMRRDDGVMLTAVEGNIGDYGLHEGKRVYCAYQILDETIYPQGGGKAYTIAVLGFDDILSKPVVRRSFLEDDYEHRADSIGSDLIKVINDRAWLGGDHLNIEFEYMKVRNNSEKHMINLVWDDIDLGESLVKLYLRHNAYGHTRENGHDMERAAGFVSFPILGTVPYGFEEVTVRLYYNWDGTGAEPSEEYIETTFRPGSPGSTPVIIGNTGENLLVTPPDAAIFLE